MRSSAILALALVAAAGPALSAPVASPVAANFARADSTTSGSTPSSSSDLSSEAIKLGTIGTIASFAAPVIGGIIDHFKNKGNPKQRRDAMELEALLARADSNEESDAVKLGTVANIASIGSSIVSAFHGLFGGQKREDIEELLARAFDDESSAMIFRLGQPIPKFPIGLKIARDAAAPADEESDAIKLGTVANIASIGSSLVSAFHGLFGGNQQKRDIFDLLARADLDESGAFVAMNPYSGGGLPRYPWLKTIFARDAANPADAESEAVRLNTIATIAGIGSNLVNVWHGIFGSNNKRSEFIELLARADPSDPDSEAVKLSTVSDIASIGSSLVNVWHGLFGGNQQKRELIEFLARADTTDESDAIKLSTLGNIASIGGSVISAVHNLFSGNQKREFEELFARAAEDDEAAAIKLSTLGNIASIGGSVISAVHNLFSSGNQSQKREFMELLARATSEDEDSEAISLKTIGTIASFAAPVIGGIVDHFTNKNQGQKREDIESMIARELMARATEEGIDESDAISLKTIGTIASFAAPLVGGIIDHFTNKNQGKRDFEDVFFQARSLNDLD